MTNITQAPVGKLALQFGHRLPLEVLQSNAGFYLGTANMMGPVSRESLEYWPSFEAAERALNAGTTAWTQRDHP